MSTPSIAERVAAGAVWLDKHRRGWWKPGRIDLEAFSIHNSCDCVLGQLYGDYWDSPLVRFHGDAKAAALGFNSQQPLLRHALQAEWVRVIQERRTQAGASS